MEPETIHQEKADTLTHVITAFTLLLKKRFKNVLTTPPPAAFNQIIWAYNRLDDETFDTTALKGFKSSIRPFCRNIDDAWGVLAEVLIRQVENERNLQHPTPTPAPNPPIQETPKEIEAQLPIIKKTFSLKIAMRLCIAWMLDPRWQKLSPCAKLLFYRLIFRTYRKDTILKIKQALSRGETSFPWCCTGIKSLSKQLTYQLRSSKQVNHYEKSQIKRSLRQLWDLGFIHRIFRGYHDQGAGKYHVFLNPKMSATFNQARVKTKQGITPKKRLSRMS